jgi:hypothetical protein
MLYINYSVVNLNETGYGTMETWRCVLIANNNLMTIYRKESL